MVYYVWEVAENLGGSKDMIGKSWGKQNMIGKQIKELSTGKDIYQLFIKNQKKESPIIYIKHTHSN